MSLSAIKERAEKITRLLKENDFFKSEGVDEEVGIDVSNELWVEFLTQKFIQGKDIHEVETKEYDSILTSIIVQATLKGLIKRGLVDALDDDGEILYLTEEGKKILG